MSCMGAVSAARGDASFPNGGSGPRITAMKKKLLYWAIAIAVILQAGALLFGQSFMPGRPF